MPQVHALLYAMGDRYQLPILSGLARAKFVASIDEPGFTLEELVAAIDVVYNTTPDGNDGLRKHVVYRAQSHMQQLKKLDSFKEIYEKYVGFSWDFGMKYRACRTVWCTACLSESKLPASCQCGFNGLCENTKICNELDWASLKCTSCKRTGQLIRDEPNDDDEVAITGTAKSKSVQGSPDGPEMRNKKKSL
jgi:hypothetical protein